MSASAVPENTAPLLVWAQWYAAQGWPVFPCKGKVPVTRHGFQDATAELSQVISWWNQWPTANIGCPIGPYWWALDVDPRNRGDDTLYALEREHGALPATLLSHTGGGGWHYLWLPPTTGHLQNKAHVGDGLDIQGPGSYIILPPSIHPDTQQAYVWDVIHGPDDTMPQYAPSWLEALVTQPAASHTASNGPGTQTPSSPILEGAREKTLMSLAGAMQRLGATYDAILAALDIENQRCVPPLDAADLERMAQSVTRYAPAAVLDVPPPPVGWSVNGVYGTTIAGTISNEWRKELFDSKKGLLQNQFNITQILRHHDYWQREDYLLWYDMLRQRYMCGKDQMTDDMLVDISHWFGGQERLSITNLALLEKCLHGECLKHARDLIKLWVQALPKWDGTPRLETWLHAITGIEDTPYNRNIGWRLIVSMVARALQPGCQYREVVIFCGKENIGKSKLAETLASNEWYIQLSMNLEAKESHMMLRKAWIAELAELDSLGRTEEARLKAFITMQDDTYIPKYKNETISVPRRTIFMGTTNDETFLRSLTGNTRFLPLTLPGQVNIAALEDIRIQLFAEAIQAYNRNPDSWWQMSPEVQQAAEEERERRRVINEYEEPLREWLEERRFATVVYVENAPVQFIVNETSWSEIATWFLRIDSPERWKDRSLQLQITAALRALGWQPATFKRDGRTIKRWQKKPASAELDICKSQKEDARWNW